MRICILIKIKFSRILRSNDEWYNTRCASRLKEVIQTLGRTLDQNFVRLALKTYGNLLMQGQLFTVPF